MVTPSPELSSFGALLKAFRKRRRLTQRQLAEALGMHRQTVIRWEQGDFFPTSKALVLELARYLHLDELETHQLVEAGLTAQAPHWYVPLPRNPFFTGREEILAMLRTCLLTEDRVALTQPCSLHGLGGVGKTQIALEYAYRHAQDYRAIFWIAAETAEGVVASLLRVAEVLQLPEHGDADRQRVIAAVQRWLSVRSRWLLIWDNVEDLLVLERFLPAVRAGATLLTTRLQNVGMPVQNIDLLPMEREEGILFLLRRAKVLGADATNQHVQQLAVNQPDEYAAAENLVEVMGGLPLALDQAGAYIEEMQCGLPTYLELFRTRSASLLPRRGAGVRDHPESVTTTLMLSITATTEHHPAVGDLLRVCSLLQPESIPEELFRQGAEHFGAQLQVVGRDEPEWNQLVAVACSYSLLHRQAEEQTLSIHRLVQAALLDTMPEEERKMWTRRAIEALDAVFLEVRPTSAHAAWEQCERLLPHALLCLHRVGGASETLTLASLAYKAALYLRVRGRYAEAEPLLLRVLHIWEHILGLDDPKVATLLNTLAMIYWSQSKYTEAEPLLLRALRILEQALGPDHPEVARPLNSLAIFYQGQGKYAEAEPLLLRALHISEQALGPDHPDVARPLNNLSSLYWNQGKYAEAEPLLLRALRILEQALGPDHPEVARPLNGLANLYWSQGDYMKVEPLYRRALSILERGLGPDHPDLAHPFNNLGEFYLERGKYAEAELLSLRALRISERALGPEHPDVARPLNNLANLYREQGQYPQAEPLYRRALSIREQHLGQQHPETAQTLHDLAILRQKQGNLDEALSLAEHALHIRSQALGDLHPHTVATRALHTQLTQIPPTGRV